jgi:hypothetical protein
MANVGGITFQLQRLEDSPTYQVGMHGGEFSEIFGEIFIRHFAGMT